MSTQTELARAVMDWAEFEDENEDGLYGIEKMSYFERKSLLIFTVNLPKTFAINLSIEFEELAVDVITLTREVTVVAVNLEGF